MYNFLLRKGQNFNFYASYRKLVTGSEEAGGSQSSHALFARPFSNVNIRH